MSLFGMTRDSRAMVRVFATPESLPMSPLEHPAAPVSLFYSYSHRDEALRKKLEAHLSLLQAEAVISGWHDRGIAAGIEWEGAISEQLDSAGIILLLVSADFLASRYCRDVEIKRAMERHEAGTARVIPVILRPVDWHTALFGKLQALPRDGKPVTSWKNRDEAFTDIARGIREATGISTSGGSSGNLSEGLPGQTTGRGSPASPIRIPEVGGIENRPGLFVSSNRAAQHLLNINYVLISIIFLIIMYVLFLSYRESRARTIEADRIIALIRREIPEVVDIDGINVTTRKSNDQDVVDYIEEVAREADVVADVWAHVQEQLVNGTDDVATWDRIIRKFQQMPSPNNKHIFNISNFGRLVAEVRGDQPGMSTLAEFADKTGEFINTRNLFNKNFENLLNQRMPNDGLRELDRTEYLKRLASLVTAMREQADYLKILSIRIQRRLNKKTSFGMFDNGAEPGIGKEEPDRFQIDR
jgi:hypothetical protein